MTGRHSGLNFAAASWMEPLRESTPLSQHPQWPPECVNILFSALTPLVNDTVPSIFSVLDNKISGNRILLQYGCVICYRLFARESHVNNQQSYTAKFRLMYQLSLENFFPPFGGQSDRNNRWVRMSEVISWYAAELLYNKMSCENRNSGLDSSPGVSSMPTVHVARAVSVTKSGIGASQLLQTLSNERCIRRSWL